MSTIPELEAKVDGLLNEVSTLKEQISKLLNDKPEIINKDGIPVGMHIFSEVDDVGEIELIVNKRDYEVKRIDNINLIEGKRFKSLSAAAEAFSQIKRKSGWVFWRDAEGKTLKELFKS